MKKIVLIGNIGNPNSGPGYVVNSIKTYLEKNKCVFKIIDTCQNQLKIFLKIFKIIFYKDSIINVHSYGYKIPYMVMLISKFNKKNQYFLTLHGIMSVENEIKGIKFSNRLENKIINNFPNIICVSDFEKNLLLKEFNREKNVFVCYNGCDFENKQYDKNEKNNFISIVDAGGVSKIKNTLGALKLIKELNEYGVKCRYFLYGSMSDYEYYCQCKKYVNDNKIQNVVKYCGKISREELKNIYYNSNYCIALSKFDTFNMTVLEAMQTGTPIITSDKVGLSRIIKNGRAGIVVNDNYNINDIVTFLKQEDKYKELCKNAYITGQKFSKNKMIKEYLKLFGE